MHVQSCCFANLNYCFLAILVAVAVVVANVRESLGDEVVETFRVLCARLASEREHLRTVVNLYVYSLQVSILRASSPGALFPPPPPVPPGTSGELARRLASRPPGEQAVKLRGGTFPSFLLLIFLLCFALSLFSEHRRLYIFCF